ncbi:hypothetical protein EB796_013882 [Bugula neritina]|uniref:Uncharacterized protein n=1 Tax=Bugula neritina TaxID=10212 RepID=A0A7J7JQ98_BUGNE|nr:hypothetical protein EB796_013882 [Bugula neritina]
MKLCWQLVSQESTNSSAAIYFVPGALTAMQTLVVVFSQAGMGYRLYNIKCQDEFPALNSTTDGNTTLNSSMMLEYNKCPEDVGLQCSGFTYNSTVFTSTIISEFDLVCGRSWIPTYINVFYMLIRLPAGLVLGQFIDRLGRKKAVLIGLFLQGAIGVASAYSVNVEMYTVFRTLSAIPVIAIWDSLATLLSEVTTPHKRPHILMGMIFAWGTGIVALSPFGYLIRDWRTLQMAISVPSFIFLIAGYWMYDESPHWLYSQGKYKEAQLVVDKIARWNRIPSFQMSSADPAADGDKSEEIQDSGESSLKNSCGRIIKSKTLMAILAVCAFSWLATNMGYTGLAFGLGSLAGDVYLNNLISGVTEFFAYCICFLVIPGGRKLIFVILMIVGGLGLVSSAVVVDFAGHLTG